MTKYSKTHPTKRIDILKQAAIKNIKSHPTIDMKIDVMDKYTMRFSYFCNECHQQRIQYIPAKNIMAALQEHRAFVSFQCIVCNKMQFSVEPKYILDSINTWRKNHGHK
jgi:hypothetical protein